MKQRSLKMHYSKKTVKFSDKNELETQKDLKNPYQRENV